MWENWDNESERGGGARHVCEWHVVLVGSAAGGHGLGMGHGRACLLHTKSVHFRRPTLILTLYNCLLPTALIEGGAAIAIVPSLLWILRRRSVRLGDNWTSP